MSLFWIKLFGSGEKRSALESQITLNEVMVAWGEGCFWCFWTVVLEKTLDSPLDCKEIQLVHPKWNQSWIFTGGTDVETETPILWLSDEKCWLIWKDPDAGKDWRWKEKGMTEDEMVGRHHWLNGHVEQAPGDVRTGKPGVLPSMGSQRVRHD